MCSSDLTKDGGWLLLIKLYWKCLGLKWRIIRRTRRMTRKWPFQFPEEWLDHPVVALRAQHGITTLTPEERATGESHQLELEGVFVQIGLVPNSAFLKESGVELTDRGEVVIDGRGATNVPGIFAAGDVSTVPYKQIVVAFGSGSTASLSAFDHLIRTSAPADEIGRASCRERV